MTEILDIALLSFMIVLAIAVSRMHNLFMAAMMLGIFSFLAAIVFTLLDAVDVAFTEAAVGAGVSTVLLLGTLSLTTREEKIIKKITHWPCSSYSLRAARLFTAHWTCRCSATPMHPFTHTLPIAILKNREKKWESPIL